MDLITVPVTDIERVVAVALAEDGGPGDLTSDGLLSERDLCTATIVLKVSGVVAGLPAAEAVFRALSAESELELLAADGDSVEEAPAILAHVEGPARALLTGERVALNLLARLSGIATLTRRFVEEIEGTGAVILDTRKTTPGLRTLEKYAVRCGGGQNHRLGLWDAILVKDNHLRLAGGIRPALERLRSAGTAVPIEVEAETLAEVAEAVEAGADRILLDNMRLAVLRKAVALVGGRSVTEASGGVSLETVRAIAETGVDFISVGALTHSARALDVSMEVVP